MLQLKAIEKQYVAGNTTVEALRGIDISFRKNEFVSVLGPSGCGKTTLLNIIGGLDRYSAGDLLIKGKSTKDFNDSDWDSYRNHSIGFVFQNYHLIPHQSVLANVELALTLSGVSKAERRQRAAEVLRSVGLADQIHKKPNQLSGGQMQRVSIARALVNNPEILLADEPTGALDSEISVQIMELLKEISKDRLVVMVTHNPEIANAYSTRIVRLLDGRILSDTNPYQGAAAPPEQKKRKAQKTSMSFFTALSLSLTNLMTKKTRTLLTAFAGSIGIIGIALILSLSNGFQAYINQVQQDTLSSYPISVQEQSLDLSNFMVSFIGEMDSGEKETEREPDRIYANNIMGDMLNLMNSRIERNNLKAFKERLENDPSFSALVNEIQYGYSLTLNIYSADTEQGVKQIHPGTLLEDMGMRPSGAADSSALFSSFGSSEVWTELFGNQTLLDAQYEIVAGAWPASYDEVVLMVNKDNEVSDYTLYSLGLKDQNELSDIMKSILSGKEGQDNSMGDELSFSYNEILDLRFKLVLNTAYYQKQGGVWVDQRDDDAYMRGIVDDGIDLRVVGIVRTTDENLSSAANGAIGYTGALTQRVIGEINRAQIVKEQTARPDTDVFTGLPFSLAKPEPGDPASAMTPEQTAYFQSLSAEEQAALIGGYPQASANAYEDNLALLGVVTPDSPSVIHIYPKDFKAKDQLKEYIDAYNREMIDGGEEENAISYTDMVGVIMSSVTKIIDTISYVLIAFVAISLIVSSIMIGIITYISVLERTKEIGILRSIGASRRDIARVFNAETTLVGFVSGLLGVLITVLLNIPINIIIHSLTSIRGVSVLPAAGAFSLVAISVLLTILAGLIPSRLAAKKDPVVALRTE